MQRRRVPAAVVGPAGVAVSATSRDVPCPACKAKVGERCRDGRTRRTLSHVDRTHAWNVAKRKAKEKLGPSKGRVLATHIARAAYWRGRSHASDLPSSSIHEANIADIVATHWRGR